MKEKPPAQVNRIEIIKTAHQISRSDIPTHLQDDLATKLVRWVRQYGHEALVWTGDPFWTDRELVTHCAAALNSLGKSEIISRELKNDSLNDGERHWLGETLRIASEKDY
ncbi:MAG: hypothetical protein AAB568_02115 [Patescibacteria group bacterium]